MFKFLKEEINNHKSTERIAYLEQKYGIVFPGILKQLYKKSDGGNMKLCVFSIDGFEFEAAALISLKPEKAGFEAFTDLDRENGFLPCDFYPLCYDRGGETYYWSSRTQKVFFVTDDDIENPILISDSIEEFFDLLNNSVVEE